MAKYCTYCGKEILPGVAFCTGCGANTQQENPAQNPPGQSFPSQTAPQSVGTTNKVIGTGAYFGLLLLFAIPIIGLLSCIVLTFAPQNENLKNFAKASLIWMIIGIILLGILAATLAVIGNILIDQISQMTDGQIGTFRDLFNFGADMQNVYNQMDGMADQYGNGVPEFVPAP